MAKKQTKKVKKSKPAAHKYVYDFGKKTDGGASQRSLLGGKGANLAEMACIGLPVPPGFTITTEVCTHFYANDQSYPEVLEEQVRKSVALTEKQLGKKLGDLKNPLLLSVRSGARDSMPGMMDTILNLGLNDETVEALATSSGNSRFAWDCYRRFIQMYGDVVMGVQKLDGEEHDPFESVIDAVKATTETKSRSYRVPITVNYDCSRDRDCRIRSKKSTCNFDGTSISCFNCRFQFSPSTHIHSLNPNRAGADQENDE